MRMFTFDDVLHVSLLFMCTRSTLVLLLCAFTLLVQTYVLPRMGIKFVVEANSKTKKMKIIFLFLPKLMVLENSCLNNFQRIWIPFYQKYKKFLYQFLFKKVGLEIP